MAAKPIGIGIIGCGTISGIYLQNLSKRHPQVRLVACADMFADKAKEAAEAYGLAACTVDELLARPDVEIVVNLTIPAAHFEINMAALRAGKHVYCEKPLAMTVPEGEEILSLAASKGLRVGCAPDTFLGAGLQTCRKAIEEGWIGRPLSAVANFVCHGHEAWHPAPAFYYRKGAGPMMDMGPYYVTALVSLLGPVESLSGYAMRGFEQRTVTSSSAANGTVVDVEVPTHYTGALRFKSGVVASMNMSFDIWRSKLPCLEIHGTEGSLILPDPNMFGGPVKVLRGERLIDAVEGLETGAAVERFHHPDNDAFFSELPMPFHSRPNMRGLGVADMAAAIQEGRPHQASGELALHVLEVLTGFETASDEKRVLELRTTVGA